MGNLAQAVENRLPPALRNQRYALNAFDCVITPISLG